MNGWRSKRCAKATPRPAGQKVTRYLTRHTSIRLLTELPARRYPVSAKGDLPQPVPRAYKARVTKQYLMHGSIGPSCAVAWFKDGTLTVWTHTQGVYPLRTGIAEMIGLPVAQVRCIHAEGSGCYGHNGADDAAADAALIAMAIPGKADTGAMDARTGKSLGALQLGHACRSGSGTGRQRASS